MFGGWRVQELDGASPRGDGAIVRFFAERIVADRRAAGGGPPSLSGGLRAVAPWRLEWPRVTRLVFLAILVVVLGGATSAAPASAEPAAPAVTVTETAATIAPSLSPDRLGVRARLTLAIDFSGGELGVPSPVQGVVLRFPAG